MPGFSSGEQGRLALLVLGCRGRLEKMAGALGDDAVRAAILALRLAVLFHHARTTIVRAAHSRSPSRAVSTSRYRSAGSPPTR